MDLQILVNIQKQTLQLLKDGKPIKEYAVSTGKAGVGECSGSLQTPRGKHLIRARIGDGLPVNTVFVGRRPTGELWTPELHEQYPGRDWMLTRILWLSGCEPGLNRLGNVDTMRRYIYIHGTHDLAKMGVPGSHGCIRMRNEDVIDLFNRVPVYTPVDIVEADSTG